MKKYSLYLSFTCILLFISHLSFAQTDYYIDSNAGNDSNSGTTAASPWANVSKLNNRTISAGSKIYLKAGSSWTGQQLKFSGSGTNGNPIVIDQYGSGAKPVIHGNGITGQGVVYLYNQQYIEINNLEITNDPDGPNDANYFIGLYDLASSTNLKGADRRGVMVAIDNYGTANHIYLKNVNINHIKGQLGSGETSVNGAVPKRTGGIFFTVLGNSETTNKKSRFNDILIDGCEVAYCENTGIAFDNEWDIFYPGGQNSSIAADVTEYNNWYDRRYSNIKISNNVIHHIGKNAMIIRCTDETGLIEKNVCYETALGTTGNTMFTARAKGTVFQYNEGYFNRSTTQTVSPGTIDGSMYDADYGSVDIIFQYSYSHDNSEGLYWACNSRSLAVNNSGVPDPGDKGVTVRYNISQNDKGSIIFFNYPSAGNEIYNNIIYIKSGLSSNIIHENSKQHTYNFYNNIIYNLSSSADYAFKSTGQTRNISNNIFYGNHPTGSLTGEPADPNKLITDPLFVNPGTGGMGINTLKGYLLKANSPAFASGMGIITKISDFNKDYYGNPVNSNSSILNRGAYEGTGLTPIFYSKANSDLSLVTNWGMETDGSGVNPPNFTSNYQNFQINNTNTIATGKTLSINGTGSSLIISPTSVFTINNGGSLQLNAKPLVLQSTALGTAAMVNKGTVTGATNVTIQRYLNSVQRGWRMLGSPLTSTPSLSSVATASGLSNLSYGASNSSAITYDSNNNSWTNLANGSDTWAATTGLGLFIRGAGSEGVGGNYTANPTSVTLSLTGTVNTSAPADVTINGGKWYLVANPYPAPISVASILQASTGLKSTIAIYSPTKAATDPKVKAGGYDTYAISTTTAGAAGDVVIPVMGTFFVQADVSGNATLNIPTSAIFTGTNAGTSAVLANVQNAEFIGLDGKTIANTNDNSVSVISPLKLRLESNGTTNDEINFLFDDQAKATTTDRFDFGKLPNTLLDFYSVSADNKNMAVDQRNLDAQRIPLGINTNLQQHFTLVVDENTVPAAKELILHDYLLNTNKVLKTGTTYEFDVTAASNSKGTQRLELIVQDAKSAITPTTNLSLQLKGETVKWWPNPAKEFLYIESSPANAQAATVEIVNVYGQKMKTLLVQPGAKANVAVANWTSGLYLIKITNGNSTTTHKLIIE